MTTSSRSAPIPASRSSRAGARAVALLAAWVVVGFGVGVGGALVGGLAPWPVSAIPHYAAPSVLLLVVLGITTPGVRVAAMAAATTFIAFVAGYYLVVATQFGTIPTGYALAWAVAAVTVCPASAAVVRFASRAAGPGAIAALTAAVAGAAVLADGVVGNTVRALAGTLGGVGPEPALVIVDLVVAGCCVVLIPRTASARVAAALLLLPCSIVSTWVGWTVHFGPGPY